jgi:hypothetical protein
VPPLPQNWTIIVALLEKLDIMDYGHFAPPPGQHHQHLYRQMGRDKSNRSSKDTERLSLAETVAENEAGSAVGHSLAERSLNREALDDLCQRIEDWKGYDVTTFGDLLLHGEMKIVSSTQSERPKMV